MARGKNEHDKLKEKRIQIALALGYRWVVEESECYPDSDSPKGTWPHQCLQPPDMAAKAPNYIKAFQGVEVELCHVPLFFNSSWGKETVLHAVAQSNEEFQSRFMAHLRDTTGISKGEIQKPPKKIKDALALRLVISSPAEVAEAFWRTVMGEERETKKPPKTS